MKRREFINKAALSAFVAGSLPYSKLLASEGSTLNGLDHHAGTALISENLQEDFRDLLGWLQAAGWIGFFRNNGIEIDPSGSKMEQFYKAYPMVQINKIRGFEDAAGMRLIEPGYPAASLLYHALASPQVCPVHIGENGYPAIGQLDVLENLIYGLKHYTDEELTDCKVAIFAYEYRPAYKTPHHQHADLVFSRTGIGRIGTHPQHYDVYTRSFSNKPAGKADPKGIAVAPARYGVFLAKVVKNDRVELIGKGENDDRNYFLQPVRKIFKDDAMIDIHDLSFVEYHLNEKLQSLVKEHPEYFINPQKNGVPLFDTSRAPFRISSADPETTVRTEMAGSTVLVCSVPNGLIRYAKQNDHWACIHVKDKSPTYFSALATFPPIEEIELIDLVLKKEGHLPRIPNKYDKPRNAPLFVNIKFKCPVAAEDFANADAYRFTEAQILHQGALSIVTENNEDKYHGDEYMAALFVDSICDGYVSVRSEGWKSPRAVLRDAFTECLPAFSIITAPDFFPLADTQDLSGFDFTDRQTRSSFYEGSLYTLSAERTLPDEHLPGLTDRKKPFYETGDTKLTFMAVYSDKTRLAGKAAGDFSQPTDRKYKSSSFLPDVCSGVFAPGWDITYANDKDSVKVNSYLSTRGLGSPFAEDMKLCAAVNGMWPVASPDAARTYQGNLEKASRNPTSLPLLDNEIGLHPASPACMEHPNHSSTGWDGEQGPFLQKKEGNYVVNFTDLSRADYLKNIIEKKVDMSQLRELSSKELRRRMFCLRACIAHLPNTNFKQEIVIGDPGSQMVGLTGLWLVSAQKMNWAPGAVACNVPRAFVGQDLQWINKPQPGILGEGYLYMFVTVNGEPALISENSKRMTQPCGLVYFCQVTEKAIAWTVVPGTGFRDASLLTWNLAAVHA